MPEEMTGKICIVTGSNSGIGKETALTLASEGARVVMIVRNNKRGESARDDIINQSGNTAVDLMIADLSSMQDIRRLAEEYRQTYSRLDVLVNNAGGIFSKRYTTVDGFEMTFALNHLAPFLLTYELLDILMDSAPSRIVNVSSGVHQMGKIELDNLQSERKFGSFRSYGTAKLLNIMFTYELARRLKHTGVAVNVLHPGFVNTNFGKTEGSRGRRLFMKLMRPFQVSAAEGARTSVYLASSPEVEGVSGQYFARQKPTKSKDISYDEDLQQKVWRVTESLLGIEYDDKIQKIETSH